MAILAIDDEDRVLLVRQYRVAIGEVLLEVPAGTLDVLADGSIEDPELAAPRELEEETGMRAGSWRLIARFFTAPGFASELMYLYLATDLRPADGERLGPDEDEHLLLEKMPWRDAVAAAERGELRDAKTILALLWLARLRALALTRSAWPPAWSSKTRRTLGRFLRLVEIDPIDDPDEPATERDGSRDRAERVAKERDSLRRVQLGRPYLFLPAPERDLRVAGGAQIAHPVDLAPGRPDPTPA